MVFIRRRYYFWLFRAYIKRWKKTIFLSVLFGCFIFVGAFALLRFQIIPKLEKKMYRIAYAGTYKSNTLPKEILQSISSGLTIVKEDGSLAPAIAKAWDIKDNGREYIFYLSENTYFHNGEKLTAHNLPLDYDQVKKTVLSDHVVSFKLSTPYAPFLTTVSRPLLLKGFVGVGEYKLSDIKVDPSGIITSLTLVHVNDSTQKRIYTFFPSEEAAKTAFVLGEADMVVGVEDATISGESLTSWNEVSVKKEIDYTKLVSIFYNTQDPLLSNKKVRQALNYALPESFSFGERALSPIPPISKFFSRSPNAGVYDKEIARSLIADTKLKSKNLTIKLSVQKEYEKVAKVIQKEWKDIGVIATIQIVDEKPVVFQALIHPFTPPIDPDQYTLWHSNQRNNITGYKNVRIDKLLEEGRLTVSTSYRSKIYADFQKYLIDDAPASFLYFPYRYTIRRM